MAMMIPRRVTGGLRSGMEVMIPRCRGDLLAEHLTRRGKGGNRGGRHQDPGQRQEDCQKVSCHRGRIILQGGCRGKSQAHYPSMPRGSRTSSAS